MGPKKKISKKEKARLEAEKAEQIRLQQEMERQRLIQAQRDRIDRERRDAELKEIRETGEQAQRLVQLAESYGLIDRIKHEVQLREIERRNNEQWDLYLKCTGKPDPSVCKDMNTYLLLWRQNLEESVTIDECDWRNDEVLQFLHLLESVIEKPLDAPKHLVDSWKIIHKDFRQTLKESLAIASYQLLRNIEFKFDMDGIKLATFSKQFKNFTLCMWTELKMPVGLHNPRTPAPPPLSINFDILKLSVQFPITVKSYSKVIRVFWVKFDHYSDQCSTYYPPKCPKLLDQDLNGYTLSEWSQKLEIKREFDLQMEMKPTSRVKSSLSALSDASTMSADGTKSEEYSLDDIMQELESTIVPRPNDIIEEREDEAYAQVRRSLNTPCPRHEINLRRYIIVGGIIHIGLLHQPPQPKKLYSDIYITTLLLPKDLEPAPFFVRYVPPPSPGPGVKRLPEDIEAELKAREVEMEKLILVNIDLPETVLWFEPPIVGMWNEESKTWVTSDVHDIKYNEDKFIMNFRTGRLGAFAIAVNRYSNLPYQTWEIKPETKGSGVIVSITAAIVIIEFIVRENEICLSALQNGPTNALQEFVGQSYKLNDLIRLLRSGGVDVFPSLDAFCYTEGTCEKHWPAEKHVYYCIAIMAIAYNFTSSRWNMVSGRRKIVFQMRTFVEKRKKSLATYSTVLVTPLKALIVDCTEVSQTFNEEGVEGMKFYSDLYHLMKGTATIASRRKIQSVSVQLVDTLAELLTATRILSLA